GHVDGHAALQGRVVALEIERGRVVGRRALGGGFDGLLDRVHCMSLGCVRTDKSGVAAKAPPTERGAPCGSGWAAFRFSCDFSNKGHQALLKYQRQSCSPTSPMNWRYSARLTARKTLRKSAPKASRAQSERSSAWIEASHSVGSRVLAWA